MRNLILVRHSVPVEVPGVPAAEWRLSDEGRRRAALLADRVAALGPASLFASDEPKAIETASFVSERTGLGTRVDPGLREHDRTGAVYLPSADWRALVMDAIRNPNELVLGIETTGAAGTRFAEAVSRVVAAAPAGDIAIVAHGTVIAMFVAELTGLDPVDTWSSLGLPGFVVVGWPEADGIDRRWNYGDSAT